MATVTLRNVTKVYSPDVYAVKEANLDVKDKEFLVLVGPSGCGKTTLLRMISGLEEVTHGEIFIGEKQVNDLSPKERDIAMVFQNYALYPHMNVYDNISFGLKLHKVPQQEIKKRIDETSKLLGIDSLLSRKPKELSGGERQRVAMGRAIVREPKVFLMDEPLSNLDAKLRIHMRAELQKLHRRLGITTLYVTHDQTEAMTLGTRIVILNRGIIQQIDTPLNLYHHPANLFVASFIGTPPMNLFSAKAQFEEGKLYLMAYGFELLVPSEQQSTLLPYQNKEITVGLRPEEIQDTRLLSTKNDTNTFEASVDFIEPLGSEVIVHFKLGSESLIARMSPDTNATAGGTLQVTLDLSKVHFFDETTGKAILHDSTHSQK